jgi:hypothetical protein
VLAEVEISNPVGEVKTRLSVSRIPWTEKLWEAEGVPYIVMNAFKVPEVTSVGTMLQVMEIVPFPVRTPAVFV